MALQEEAVDAALKLVRNLIERLRTPSDDNDDEAKGGKSVFFETALGGLQLTGKTDKQYRECLDRLVALYGKNPAIHLQSQSAVKELLHRTILRVIRPRKDLQSEKRATFQRRINRELLAARKQLLINPHEWMVSIQVQGIKDTTLPFTFGSVEFINGTEDAGRTLATAIVDYQPSPKRVSKKEVQAQQFLREEERKRVMKMFSREVIATSSVRAFDAEAAEKLGTEKIRRAVDILNFFAPAFHEFPDVHRAFVAPEGPRTSLPSLVRRNDIQAARWIEKETDDRPIEKIDPTSEKARKYGLARAGEIFSQQEHTDLDRRIINALSWAGRATVEQRREEAFLMFAIALEALLTNPNARSGVTDRIRNRATWLIGQTPEARKSVNDLVGRLYARRSDIVHAGDSTDLTDRDLLQIRRLVQSAVIRILTDPHFSKMKKAKEFENWLDDRLWSGSP